MTYKFPEAPTQGLVITLPNGRRLQFNDGKWSIYLNTLPQNVTPTFAMQPPVYSEAAPELPSNNPYWFNTAEVMLYVATFADGDWYWQKAAPSFDPSATRPIEQETPPALPTANPFWFRPSNQVLHYQYNDGNSTQWVEI